MCVGREGRTAGASVVCRPRASCVGRVGPEVATRSRERVVFPRVARTRPRTLIVWLVRTLRMSDREFYFIVGTLVVMTLIAVLVTQTGIIGPSP